MINSLGPGDPLPEQPPGPFGSSDVTTMMEIIYNPGFLGKPFVQCLRHYSDPQTPDPLLGWSQVGELQSPLRFVLAIYNYFGKRDHPCSLERLG